jgi:hypothetical protein
MKFTAHIMVTALFALGLSGIASAESPVSTEIAETNAFEAVTHDQLDAAFEDFSGQNGLELSGLAGPTSMDCANSPEGDIETCVVRPVGVPLPAALAAR